MTAPVANAAAERPPKAKTSPLTVPWFSRLMGLVLRDVILTPDEYWAMANGLADTDGPATGTIALSEWLAAHGDTLGLRYANELERHF